MAAEDLPSEFDVVILGTGLAESVVAAACSRVGQRVLHLDRNSYYAANWASFTFNGLLTWIQQHHEESQPEEVQDWSSLLEEGEELIYLSYSDSTSISNLQQTADSEGVEPTADLPRPSAIQGQSEASRKKISYAQLVKEGRQFNIDLVSKLMFSRGSLVDLLIKSNVSRYAEFKNVTRILTYRHGNVEQVPCSRADVFASRQLSVVEKRKLMRFLTSCLEETEEQQGEMNIVFSLFLCDQQLGDNLEHFLLHSIAMVTEDTPTEVGLASTRHFLRCLGRYGNTPFLFPVYGLGEIPQCFCRMSAVFGGVYCLRHSVRCLLVDKDNRCKAVIDSRGQRISCSHFVVDSSFSLMNFVSSCLPPQVSMVTVPPIAAGFPVVMMVELCSSTMTCLPGTYLVHLTCQSVGSAFDDLSPVVTKMFHTPETDDQETRPSVLWCLYFNMADGLDVEVEGHNLPSNVYLCSGPDGHLGHDHAIRQAQLIFQKILPEEDFCPPAPNPEDVLYDGESLLPTGGGGGDNSGWGEKGEETKENPQTEE
uniref:Rab proteins geranylgeranyltransferase component A n=1 Tax=Echeneis naucrates TaxID=173247 RepID=A0A665TFS9_ECHNA